MLDEDQLKIAQRALDYLLANADLTTSEKAAANRAYGRLDAFIDGDSIATVWSIEDVFSVMFPDEDGTRGHTDEEVATARQVLKNVDDYHDATIGINWDVLREHLEMTREAA